MVNQKDDVELHLQKLSKAWSSQRDQSATLQKEDENMLFKAVIKAFKSKFSFMCRGLLHNPGCVLCLLLPGDGRSFHHQQDHYQDPGPRLCRPRLVSAGAVSDCFSGGCVLHSGTHQLFLCHGRRQDLVRAHRTYLSQAVLAQPGHQQELQSGKDHQLCPG